MATRRKISDEERRRMIAEAAYFRAQARGFTGGDPLDDWLLAEHEIDARLETRPRAEHWLKQLESRLATGRDKFMALKQQAGSKGKAARAELRKDLQQLDRKLDSLEKKLGALRERGEKATEKARQQAEKVWDEISELTHRLGGGK